MDTSNASDFFKFLVECFNKDKKKVKELFLTLSKVFSNPSGPHFGMLLRDFPSLKLLQWIKDQIPNLILCCPPQSSSSDELDCVPNLSLSQVLSEQAFVKLFIEVSSSLTLMKQLYESLEQLALQLPGIGIAELLVSSPLFHILGGDHTTTSGTTATLSKECAEINSWTNSEQLEKTEMKMDSSQQEILLQNSDLCEVSQPRKRERKETPILKDYSSNKVKNFEIVLLIISFRYIVLRQGKGPDEKGSVYLKGSRWELSASSDETAPIPSTSSNRAEGDEVCDCYEEMDSTQELFVEGSRKRPGEDIESLELSSMGNSGQFGKRGKFERKKFEPTRIAESVVEKIEEMLETYIYSPPQTITNSIYWVQDPKCKFISAETPEFKQAINNWQTKLSHWSYEEFKNFYKVQRHYIFRRGVNYHSVEDSFTYAKLWLEQQAAIGNLLVYRDFGYSRETIDARTLLQKISNIVNRREKKRFGLVFQGHNSCGKTWFTNMILDFYINKGELQNWNRYQNSNFPFMGLVNRRIALWNEGRLNGDDMQLEVFRFKKGEECNSLNYTLTEEDPSSFPCPHLCLHDNDAPDRPPLSTRQMPGCTEH